MWTSSAARAVFALLLAALLAGCSTTPPRNINSACAIFAEKDNWYQYAHRAYKQYGVPVHVQLAIVYQESRFKYDAKPEREYILWVIPWFRKSSAYGYAQVKDETWDWYKQKTGRWHADRDKFADAVEFIAWYGDLANRKAKVSKWDAYALYLAYHEGIGGFQRKTYLKKRWLIDVARKVKRRAGQYGAQLKRCEAELDTGWSLWPF